jgi:hypothetical protein
LPSVLLLSERPAAWEPVLCNISVVMCVWTPVGAPEGCQWDITVLTESGKRMRVERYI